MEPIPVIDVRYGVAVAAARGERTQYRPLTTPLATSSDPIDVARGYRKMFAFEHIYLADLDGIEGRGRNEDLPLAISAVLPGVRLWVDAGTQPAAAARRIADEPHATLVLGSESVTTAADVADLRALPRDRYVLSLDFKGDAFVGPREVLDEPQYWPEQVIVMTLARVGSGEGPDLSRIGQIVSAAGERRVFAAGGVRDLADIEALHVAGVSGVLLATALHAEKIKAGDLHQIAGL